jgi:hypothetical protein
MPNADRYQGFKAALGKNAEAFAMAEDDPGRAAASLAVLQGTILYLRGDPEIFDKPHLLHPLVFLENALRDASGGAKLEALRRAASQRPAGLTRDAVQGTVVFCLDLLVEGARIRPAEAAKYVANTARRQGVRTGRGDDLAPGQITGWRNELNLGRGTHFGPEHRRRLREHYREWFKAPPADQRDAHRQGCKKLVGGLLKGVYAVASQAAPSRRRAKT